MSRLFFSIILISAYSGIGFSQGLANLEIKEYTKSAPFFISKSPSRLAEYLTSRDSLPAQKVLNIYTWVIHNIRYDLRAAGKVRVRIHSVRRTLRRRKGICYQYSNLISVLCHNSGVSSREIVGYSRGLSYLDGQSFYEEDHSWNGVKIDSAWYLLDATWGSGAVAPKPQRFNKLLFNWLKMPYIANRYRFAQNPSYSFFLSNPAFLIADHLPVDPAWQLVKFPVSVQSYECSSWKGYSDIADSSYSNVMALQQYREILDSYEFLSPIQYLDRTAVQANNFNVKNYKLLSISYFSKASTPQKSRKNPQSAIGINNKSIENLKAATSYAARHQRSIRSETKDLTLKYNHIQNEFDAAVVRRVKSARLQKQKSTKALQKITGMISKHAARITTLQDYVASTSKDSLGFVRPTKIRPEVVQQNTLSLAKLDSNLRTARDTAQKLLLGIKGLIEQKTSLQKSVISSSEALIERIYASSLSIRTNEKMATIAQALQQLDSLGKLIDSVMLEVSRVENLIGGWNSTITNIQSKIISETKTKEQLLNQNCQHSNGEECDKTSYLQCSNERRTVYEDKLAVQNALHKMHSMDYQFHSDLLPMLSRHIKETSVTGKLISYFFKQQMREVLFKQKKGLYGTNRIIRKSNRKIRSLILVNRRLKKRMRNTRPKEYYIPTTES